MIVAENDFVSRIVLPIGQASYFELLVTMTARSSEAVMCAAT